VAVEEAQRNLVQSCLDRGDLDEDVRCTNADLIVIPIVLIYRKYYGGRYTALTMRRGASGRGCGHRVADERPQTVASAVTPTAGYS
jgi:hypothetical protein